MIKIIISYYLYSLSHKFNNLSSLFFKKMKIILKIKKIDIQTNGTNIASVKTNVNKCFQMVCLLHSHEKQRSTLV